MTRPPIRSILSVTRWPWWTIVVITALTMVVAVILVAVAVDYLIGLTWPTYQLP